jgi:hypothetical protein
MLIQSLVDEGVAFYLDTLEEPLFIFMMQFLIEKNSNIFLLDMNKGQLMLLMVMQELLVNLELY